MELETKFLGTILLIDKGLKLGILKGEISLYCWPPVWLVWNQLYDRWHFLFLFAKQTNPNQSNRRSMVQWYFPLQYSLVKVTDTQCQTHQHWKEIQKLPRKKIYNYRLGLSFQKGIVWQTMFFINILWVKTTAVAKLTYGFSWVNSMNNLILQKEPFAPIQLQLSFTLQLLLTQQLILTQLSALSKYLCN